MWAGKWLAEDAYRSVSLVRTGMLAFHIRAPRRFPHSWQDQIWEELKSLLWRTCTINAGMQRSGIPVSPGTCHTLRGTLSAPAYSCPKSCFPKRDSELTFPGTQVGEGWRPDVSLQQCGSGVSGTFLSLTASPASFPICPNHWVCSPPSHFFSPWMNPKRLLLSANRSWPPTPELNMVS